MPITTPSVLMRDELGLWSVKNQITMKKLTYLQRVLKMNNNITKTILLEQLNMPGPTWLAEVTQKMNDLDITISLDDISKMTKFRWKKMIRERITKLEITQNIQEQVNKTKGRRLAPPNMKMKKYLLDMKHSEALIMLKLRTGMIDVRENFRSNFDDLMCPMCRIATETADHMMACTSYSSEPISLSNSDAIWSAGESREDLIAMSVVAKTVTARLCERDRCLVMGTSDEA